MSERDLRQKEIQTYNPYNTRGPNMNGKLPIGPICMPSKTSIAAVIDIIKNYTPTDELFFVSDKNGKLYTTKTNAEHNALIKELKAKGLWYIYQ